MGWQADVLQVALCLPTALPAALGFCPIDIGGVVEQGDVEIRAPPEAPEEWALRGDIRPWRTAGAWPFQLRLHERPGKRGD